MKDLQKKIKKLNKLCDQLIELLVKAYIILLIVEALTKNLQGLGLMPLSL